MGGIVSYLPGLETDRKPPGGAAHNRLQFSQFERADLWHHTGTPSAKLEGVISQHGVLLLLVHGSRWAACVVDRLIQCDAARAVLRTTSVPAWTQGPQGPRIAAWISKPGVSLLQLSIIQSRRLLPVTRHPSGRPGSLWPFPSDFGPVRAAKRHFMGTFSAKICVRAPQRGRHRLPD